MIALKFPILPVLQRDDMGELKLYKRNTKLITPKDFDYSPYFDVIKYPILDFDELTIYRKMPWDKDGVIFNDNNEPFIPVPENIKNAVNNTTDDDNEADNLTSTCTGNDLPTSDPRVRGRLWNDREIVKVSRG